MFIVLPERVLACPPHSTTAKPRCVPFLQDVSCNCHTLRCYWLDLVIEPPPHRLNIQHLATNSDDGLYQKINGSHPLKVVVQEAFPLAHFHHFQTFALFDHVPPQTTHAGDGRLTISKVQDLRAQFSPSRAKSSSQATPLHAGNCPRCIHLSGAPQQLSSDKG